MKYRPGDLLSIRHRTKSLSKICPLPNDGIESICECCEYDGTTLTVRYPYPIKHRDGRLDPYLTLVSSHKTYYTCPERIIQDERFEPGNAKYTRLVPVDTLFRNYWERNYSQKAYTHILAKDSWFGSLENDIVATGLRSPVVVYSDLNIMWGRHRVAVYKRLGFPVIECFITTKTFEEGRVEAREARRDWWG